MIQVPTPIALATALEEVRGGTENLPENNEEAIRAWVASSLAQSGLREDAYGLDAFEVGEETPLNTAFRVTLHGEDGVAGGSDDVTVNFLAGGGIDVGGSARAILEKGAAQIEEQFRSNGETLPVTAEGAKVVGELLDPWGKPIQYRMVNRNTFRLTSLGADGAYMTPSDQVLTVSISRPSLDAGKKDKPLTWREKQILAIYGEEGQKQIDRERGGVPTLEMNVFMVGGQTNLEGEDYFWFFTKVMLGTAMLLFWWHFYREKTYLQEGPAA